MNKLIYHMRIILGPIALPSENEFVPSLPRTRSGKIMCRGLKPEKMGIDPGDIPAPED
jgi:acetyl-CoA synthetase